MHFGVLGEDRFISVRAPYLACHLCEYPTEVDDSVLTLHSSVWFKISRLFVLFLNSLLECWVKYEKSCLNLICFDFFCQKSQSLMLMPALAANKMGRGWRIGDSVFFWDMCSIVCSLSAGCCLFWSSLRLFPSHFCPLMQCSLFFLP